MRLYKILVQKNPDGYTAYPVGLKGIAAGHGETFEDALKSVKSEIVYHAETFGVDVLEIDPPVLEAFVAEVIVDHDNKSD
jgi:predicted RNase H-like HicB family nuclease